MICYPGCKRFFLSYFLIVCGVKLALSLSLHCFIAVPSLGKWQYRDNKSPKFLGSLIGNSCYLFLVQWLCFCKIIFCHLHTLPSCSASLFSPSLFCGVSRSLAWLLTLLALALRLRVLLPLLALPLCKKKKKKITKNEY